LWEYTPVTAHGKQNPNTLGYNKGKKSVQRTNECISKKMTNREHSVQYKLKYSKRPNLHAE